MQSRLVLDAHTGVFNDPKWAWTRRVFLWFARRSTLVIVTNKQLVEDLERAGINAVDLHDPPTASSPSREDDATRSDRPDRNVVVVPCSFSSDEPIEAILEAAKRLHDVTFYLTGPLPQRLPASWVKHSPKVAFTGNLPKHRYDNLLHSADVVMSLTTRELTMQRAGYEALSFHKPLLTSDTEVLREYFTEGTVFTSPYADDIWAGVLKSLENRDSLAEGMASLHRQKLADWDFELSYVKRYIEHLP